MYTVHTYYFNEVGNLLGRGTVLSPGKEEIPLKEFIKHTDNRTFLGKRPDYIMAWPETGKPVLVITKREVQQHASDRLRRRLF